MSKHVSPFVAVRFDPVPVLCVYPQVRNFMDIGEKEQIGVQIAIDGDLVM